MTNVHKFNPDSLVVKRINRTECKIRKKRNGDGILAALHAAVIVVTITLLSHAVIIGASDSEISSKDSMKSHEGESREFIDAINPSKLLDKIPKIQATVIDKDDVPHDKTFFGEDANGYPIVVGTWFQYGSYTLAVAMFGTAFMVACAATAVYYVLFVVTEPSQSRSSRSMTEEPSTGWWDANRTLEMLRAAYEIYDNRDQLARSECQNKLVCEMNERKILPEQSMMRKISDAVFNADYLPHWTPMLSATKSLKEAYKHGLDGETSCSSKYSKCSISLNKVVY